MRGFRGRKWWTVKAKEAVKNSTSGANVSTGLSQSGMLDARDRRKYRWRCGFPLHRKGRRD